MLTQRMLRLSRNRHEKEWSNLFSLFSLPLQRVQPSDTIRKDMKNEKITCDQCGKQLNIDSSYPHNYGLSLTAKDYGVNTTGKYFAIAQYPPIDSDKDFCGPKCLKEWISGDRKWFNQSS